MIGKTLKIPKWLQNIHGEETTILCLTLTYLTGILYGASFLVFSDINLPVWKSIIAFIIFFDIGGGVIANFSVSVKNFYQKNENLKPVFLLLHILQPILMVLVLPHEFVYFISIGVYTVIGSFIILFIKKVKMQKIIALILFTLGVIISFFLISDNIFINSFGILFMTKLLLGFSIERPLLD